MKGTETIYRIRGDQRFEAQVDLSTKTVVSERPVGKRLRFPGGNN